MKKSHVLAVSALLTGVLLSGLKTLVEPSSNLRNWSKALGHQLRSQVQNTPLVDEAATGKSAHSEDPTERTTAAAAGVMPSTSELEIPDFGIALGDISTAVEAWLKEQSQYHWNWSSIIIGQKSSVQIWATLPLISDSGKRDILPYSTESFETFQNFDGFNLTIPSADFRSINDDEFMRMVSAADAFLNLGKPVKLFLYCPTSEDPLLGNCSDEWYQWAAPKLSRVKHLFRGFSIWPHGASGSATLTDLNAAHAALQSLTQRWIRFFDQVGAPMDLLFPPWIPKVADQDLPFISEFGRTSRPRFQVYVYFWHQPFQMGRVSTPDHLKNLDYYDRTPDVAIDSAIKPQLDTYFPRRHAAWMNPGCRNGDDGLQVATTAWKMRAILEAGYTDINLDMAHNGNTPDSTTVPFQNCFHTGYLIEKNGEPHPVLEKFGLYLSELRSQP